MTVNVLDLAGGLQPKRVSVGRGGAEYACPCPLCGGNDRFRIWPDQNEGRGSFWCRQCGARGDNIQFVMDTQKMSFGAACRAAGEDMIAGRYSRDQDGSREAAGAMPPEIISVPAAHQATVRRHPEADTAGCSLSLWQEKAAKLVAWAVGRLPGSDGEVLITERGVGAENAAAAGLGWIPEDIYRPRESWGLPTVMKKDTGLPKKLWIPRGLVIPYYSGAVVSRLRIRRPDGEPRYYVVPGSSMAPMVLGAAAGGRCLVVVESELDAILLDQAAGDITGVVAMGSSHARPNEATDALLRQALCILVALDADDAGKSSFEWWSGAYPRARRWPVPQGKDPSDAHRAGVDLRTWVIAGWPAGWLEDVQGGGGGHSPARGHVTEDPREPCSPVPLHDPVLSPLLEELHGIMRKNPAIRVLVTDSRLAIFAPPDWRRRNEGLFSRMSRLVYFEPEIFGYLHRHGAPEINIDNLLKGDGWK